MTTTTDSQGLSNFILLRFLAFFLRTIDLFLLAYTYTVFFTFSVSNYHNHDYVWQLIPCGSSTQILRTLWKLFSLIIGNSIEQYRAAIGIYHYKNRGNLKVELFAFFSVNHFLFFLLICCKKSLKPLHISKSFTENFPYLKFWFQILVLLHI